MTIDAKQMIESMRQKGVEFDFSKHLEFSFEEGLTTFRNSRLLIFDANAIGLLRQNLIVELGVEQAREFFLRFGYQHGFSDLRQMKVSFEYKDDAELLCMGPLLHTYEGIVKAIPKDLKFNFKTREFYFTGIWKNSYEADQHRAFNTISNEPVCWSLAGYASGWSTAFFGSPLLAIEPCCVGMGDDHCEWLIQPPSKFGPEAAPYIEALKIFWDPSSLK